MATIELDLVIDKQGLEDGLDEAFLDGNLLLGRKLQQKIASPIWQWTDGALRDIIDSGDLLQSYRPRAGTREYEHTWSIDYALPVLLGAVFESREGSLPARNWILATLRETDFAELVMSQVEGID